jgi:spiro-SPASM protein
MNNIVIINAADLTEYALEDLGNGKNSLEAALAAASEMPETSRKAALIAEDSLLEDLLKDFELVTLEDFTPSGLIRTLSEISGGCDNLFYFYADCPFIDTGLSKKMYDNHRKYFSEYTFADGYPDGTGVEIIKTSILPSMAKLAENIQNPIERNALFKVIEKDINAFDIETEISPDDQRLLRVCLYPDTKRNFLQLKSLSGILADHEYAQDSGSLSSEVLKAVRSRGDILRTLPAFYEIETTASTPQRISYLPEERGSEEAEMSVSSFKEILKGISDFSEDAVISLSIRNEPSLHTSPAELALSVLSFDKFHLLIETSGPGWSGDELERILNMDQKRITWIIDLDALDREVYGRLRGPGYEEAYTFAGKMVSGSKDNTYLQVVRMKENEEDTEQFYKYWKEKTNNVIIQKYDWCCGRLEQRKVTDLSPVKRLPCWHLKRDMVIRVDGTVPLCRDDLFGEMVCGNVLKDSLQKIWLEGEKYYHQHLREEYPGICRKCDEYYTYNY